jgi:NADP-dependent 3-hydroxy acid dehydrogenase YdfG
MTKRSDMETFIDFARSEFGQIDVVVNNAGIMPLSPLASLKVDEWDRMIDVNIRGFLHSIATSLPIMKRQGFGHFVNLHLSADTP